MDESPLVIPVTIADECDSRLDKALSKHLPQGTLLSRTRISQLIREGAVTLDSKAITKTDTRVHPGQIWFIRVPEVSGLEPGAENIRLDIVFEDKHVLVINKPSGMVVHPAAGNYTGTLVNAILYHCGDRLSGIGGRSRPGIVHRLDKDTSGLIVVAKSDLAMNSLTDQFASRKAKRTYHAIVHGVPKNLSATCKQNIFIVDEPGGVTCLSSQMGRHPNNRKKQAVIARGGRLAITRFRIVTKLANQNCAMIECWLETGRTHQIRVHLSHAGYPLVGDKTYGSGMRTIPATSNYEYAHAVTGFQRQALHASALELEHPFSQKVLRFNAPLPIDMNNLLVKLTG